MLGSNTEIVQGTPEWLKMRCGLITASKIADVMQEKKGTGYANYQAQLVAERLTGCISETYKNAYMERGNEDEGAARECYEFVAGNKVEQVAFVKHPYIERAGCSPDGLIESDGLVEIKRKIPALHIAYLLKKEVPTEYRKQMMFQMACTGRSWCDFASYCPELPEEMQLFTIRYHRDEEAVKAMETAVIAFDNSIEKMIESLHALRS